MEVMVEKICLDTDVCIALLRGDPHAGSLKGVLAEREVSLSVITLFELSLRRSQLDVVEEFAAHFCHLPIDSAVARKASQIEKLLRQRGDPIDLRDLFIAATCIVHNHLLLTGNRKHFERVPELRLVDAP